MSWISRTLYAAGAAASAYTGISALMALGLMRSTRLRPEDTPATVGLPYESVEFPSRYGRIVLRGWLVPPPGCTDMHDAMGQRWIVLLHGFGANRSDPTTGLLGLARDLRDRNFGLLLFDMRSSGDSSGQWNSAGFYERFDLLGALDYLAERGADRQRIGVLGHSMGGAVALMACSTPGTAAAVVADSSFADLWLMIRRAQSGIGRALMFANPGMNAMTRFLFGVDIGEVSPAKSLATSESPVFIIHGDRDSVVPANDAKLLAKAAGSDSAEIEKTSDRLWIVPGAGHLEAYRTAHDEYVNRVSAFFDRHLATGARLSLIK
jgi:pimeloyl-ACP methyl ester carboxylesterase